jgi:hypothetical protein
VFQSSGVQEMISQSRNARDTYWSALLVTIGNWRQFSGVFVVFVIASVYEGFMTMKHPEYTIKQLAERWGMWKGPKASKHKRYKSKH